MARLNIDFEPVPQVAPVGAAPTSGMHIQANPAAFGAPVAQGLEKLGQGVERVAEAGADILNFHDKVSADYEVNNFIDARTKAEYGDPNRTVTGPDGKPARDTGYFGLTGRAALDAQNEALSNIAQARQRGLDNLTSPRAKLLFDTETRRMYADSQMRISKHADDQQKTWAQGVNATGADLNLNGYAATIVDHPDSAEDFYHRYIDAQVKAAQLKFGNDPDIIKDVVAKSKQNLLETQVNAIAVKDPAGAIQLLDKPENKVIAGARYDDIYNRLRSRSETQNGVSAANKYIVAATGLNGSGTTVAGANAPAAVRYNNPGAMWMGPTAARWGATSKVDLPGGNNIAVFDNPVNGAAAHLDLLRSNYSGMTLRDAVTKWSGGNSASAYTDFVARQSGVSPDTVLTRDMLSGGTGVAIAKAQAQWEAGRPSPVTDEQWQKASQMVSQGAGAAPAVMTTTSATGAPSVAAPAAPDRHLQLAEALRGLESDPDLDDRAREVGRQRIQQEFRILEIVDNQGAKAKTEAANKAGSGYVTQLAELMHTPNPPPYAYVELAGKIAHDPALEADPHLKENLLDRVRHVSGEESMLAFGPGYMAAREALFSPADAPGHINDFADLVKRTDITLAGLQDLHTRMNLAKGDVDKQAVERRVNSFLQGAKHDLSFEEDNGFFKLRDPKGEAIYHYQFVPDFVKRASDLAQDAQRTGDRKKLDDFLSAENVQKMVGQYRDKRAMERDKLAARGEALAEKGAPADQPLPATPEGVNPAGWVPVVSKPPTTASGKPWPMAQWAQYLDGLRKDPSEENKAEFNQAFGMLGLNADQVLEKFKQSEGKPEAAAPAPESAPAAPPPELPRVIDAVSEEFKREQEDPNNPAIRLRERFKQFMNPASVHEKRRPEDAR